MFRTALVTMIVLMYAGQVARPDTENWIFQHNDQLTDPEHYHIDQQAGTVQIYEGFSSEVFAFEARVGEWVGGEWRNNRDSHLLLTENNRNNRDSHLLLTEYNEPRRLRLAAPSIIINASPSPRGLFLLKRRRGERLGGRAGKREHGGTI